jgi:hypothetical protein
MTPANEARFINSRVFALRLQVVQEHDALATDRYDGRGQASMTYTPGPIADEEVLARSLPLNSGSRRQSGPGRHCLSPVGSPGWIDLMATARSQRSKPVGSSWTAPLPAGL